MSGGTLSDNKYIQIGKTVFARFKYVLAGAGISGTVSFTLPVTAQAGIIGSDNGEIIFSSISLVDAGVAYYRGMLTRNTTTSAVIRQESGNNLNAISSTSPFTWGASDFLSVWFSYEAA